MTTNTWPTPEEISKAVSYLQETGHKVIKHKEHFHLFNEDGKPLSPSNISAPSVVAIAKFEKEKRA